MNLKQKKVVLTGASGGIGQEIAKSLADAGASLVLVGRSAEKLARLQAECEHAETQHQYVAVDLMTSEGRAQLNDYCLAMKQRGEGIDIVINNAGGNTFGWFASRDPEALQQEIQLNLVVPMLIAQSALNWFQIDQESASLSDRQNHLILNIGSTFGSIGYPGYVPYCAAKAGLMRMSEALDRELVGQGVRVLHLAPRATDTGLNSSVVQEMNQALGNRSDSPAWVAAMVKQSLEQEIATRWIGWPEKLFARINQWFPKLVAASLSKQHPTIKQFLNQVSGTSNNH